MSFADSINADSLRVNAMRNVLLCFLLIAAAAGGPFLWAWLRTDTGRDPVPLSVDGPSVDGPQPSPRAAEIDDVEPPSAANPMIQAMRRMIEDSPAFEEHGDELREQLTQADELLSRIKEDNRRALASLRDGPSRRTRPRSRPQSPHIILLDLGDLSIDELRCYDERAAKTPLFDLLASQGVRFTNHYHSFVETSAERSALLSASTQVGDNNLVQSFVDAGYEASIIGNCVFGGAGPSQHGFDSWFGATTLERARTYLPKVIESNGASIQLGGGENLEFDAQMIYVTEAISFAERQRANHPFFLWLSLPTPDVEFFEQGAEPKSAEEKTSLRRGQIKRLEIELAEFIASLNRQGWAKTSVVILTSLSTRRPISGDALESDRQRRAPLIVLGPGTVKRGVVDRTLTCTADLWATIADIVDADCSATESHSFYRAITGKRSRSSRTRKHLSWKAGDRSLVRFGDWLYSHTPGQESALYDVTGDTPAENVAGFHPQLVVRGKELLAETKTN